MKDEDLLAERASRRGNRALIPKVLQEVAEPRRYGNTEVLAGVGGTTVYRTTFGRPLPRRNP